jgi:2-oxoglutarate ferredoxin oxidoreductase subunit alpha
LQDDITVVLGGQAGQGIQTIEYILARVLKRSGFHIFSTKEYMSRIRGGSNTITVRVAGHPVTALTNRIDLLVPLDRAVMDHVKDRMSADTVVLGDTTTLNLDTAITHIPISDIAKAAGGKIYENTVAVGVLAGILKADPRILIDYVREYFSVKNPEVIEHNIEAAEKGFEAGSGLGEENGLAFSITSEKSVADRLLINGAEAVAMGAIAGGCNFICSYPMSPSTGVLAFLSSHDDMFGIVAEQAEDEIAAVNMGVAAWYAGARALVTTSGGGFALMGEGISLSGVLETPLVIHLAQRPGPGTGLPTRTEQGDLDLALHAGHGEFPRVIYAPGTIDEAFALTARAFNTADRYQVPVFILTDQYIMDTYYDVAGLNLEAASAEKHIVETRPGYLRYRITDSGISPRGVPGHGKGFVTADSDEHDEDGHITESIAVRTAMVNKRLRKMNQVIGDSLSPVLSGDENYQTLFVGWGSTFHVIREALERSGKKGTAHLHFPQVYPLAPLVRGQLEQARKIVVVENNATGQFGRLLKTFSGREPDHTILKYDGLPFTVEALADSMRELG